MIIEKYLIILLAIGTGFSVFPEKLTLDEGDKYIEHIKTLLAITTGNGSDRRVTLFMVVSIGIALIAFSIVVGKLSFTLSIVTLIVFLMLPYGTLRVKLNRIRIESSREGEILITELLNNYKIQFFNMREAIEKTAISIENAPNSKKLLFNLSQGLQRAGNERDIKKYINEFRMSINTSWGNVLSSNLEFSLISGIKVEEAISVLAGTITKARKLEEYSRRENNEARLMLNYLAPCAYLITVCSAVFYFGMSFEQFIYYQFRTEVGLTWFMISLMMYLVGLLMQSFVLRTKLDF